MRFTAIRSEGGLLPEDMLEKIASGEAEGQKAEDFGLPKGRRLTDEIQRVWSDAHDLWDIFQRRRDSLPEKDPYGTTLTRERWIVPLLADPQIFAYELKFQTAAFSVDGLSFPISHFAGEPKDNPPVDIEGFKIDLDHRAPKLRTSPRAMVQEFLNHSEPHVWGIVTNGLRFLLLRDSDRTSRPSYLEFDLETILQAGLFNEFALFYRLCHRSRLPRPGQPLEDCLLERYYQLSIEQGGRVRDKLRDGVEEALKILGTGFLRHPKNQDLRERLASGGLKAADYHRQLLRLVYRLLFLIVAEERHLIVAMSENAERNQLIYRDWYSISRLRERAEGIVEESEFSDLWIGLRQTFALFSDSRDSNPLGIPPLNGDLFSSITMPDLESTELYNHDLLQAIRRLTLFQEDHVQQRVNYAALDVEELGSVYESLLDFRPEVAQEPEGWEFKLATGSERKTTGSYYTRPELVRELIQSALVPVLEDRLNEAEKQASGKSPETVREAKINAILGMTVCDPACGSGHFLLEAARRLGRELARVKTGEDEPTPEAFHLGIRDVISHCIYGVDVNPLAVDLCKLALWLEGHWAGKPLSFLDHRIRCGNSLVGVLDFKILEKGIPDDAFTPVTGDDKKVAAAFKKRNRQEREIGQRGLDFDKQFTDHGREFAELLGSGLDFPEDTPADVRRKSEAFEKARRGLDWWHDWTTANLWTAAFFASLKRHDDPEITTHQPFMDFLLHGQDRPQATGAANALVGKGHSFHWPLEFPEAFARGGFDVVLGNPPWERIKLQEEEFWAEDPFIATAPNKAERFKRIEKYRVSEDSAKRERVGIFDGAKHAAEDTSKFVREAGRFPLTAVGDINTYALFAELAQRLINPAGRAGIIVPTGIATDDTNKQFFAGLNREHAIASLFDLENREALFPGVHRSYKFSLFTIGARPVPAATFACFLTRAEQIRDPVRRFQLSPEDFALLNPNTQTLPVFRTWADAELTKKIYRRVPVLVNERTGENPWGISFLRMFDMSNDSGLFRTEPGPGLVPLYEGKMVQAYDHRAASTIYVGSNRIRQSQPLPTTREQHSDPAYAPAPLWWVEEEEVVARVGAWERKWLIGFKDITSPTNERTVIFTVLPRVAVGNKIPLVLFSRAEPPQASCFLANANSLVLDYAARQKIGGITLNFFIVKQLPWFAPGGLAHADLAYVRQRVLRLVYTSWDTRPFAEDLGYSGTPFPWDEGERAALQAELDAYFAHLYGLTRDELRYILDPKDVLGGDFPSETFRVLKEKEEKELGEYRTRRLVLAAYDELAKTDRFAGEKRESAIEAPKGRSMVSV